MWMKDMLTCWQNYPTTDGVMSQLIDHDLWIDDVFIQDRVRSWGHTKEVIQENPCVISLQFFFKQPSPALGWDHLLYESTSDQILQNRSAIVSDQSCHWYTTCICPDGAMMGCLKAGRARIFCMIGAPQVGGINPTRTCQPRFCHMFAHP